jgi:hypothetical protein
MMPIVIFFRIVALAGFLLTTACSTRSVYTGLYEGVRVKNQLDATPSERFGKPEPPADYQQYEMMRQETLKRNSQSSP